MWMMVDPDVPPTLRVRATWSAGGAFVRLRYAEVRRTVSDLWRYVAGNTENSWQIAGGDARVLEIPLACHRTNEVIDGTQLALAECEVELAVSGLGASDSIALRWYEIGAAGVETLIGEQTGLTANGKYALGIAAPPGGERVPAEDKRYVMRATTQVATTPVAAPQALPTFEIRTVEYIQRVQQVGQ